MGDVALLYVGAALFLNGMVLLGKVDARASVPLNLFVGGLQVVTPTYLIASSGGDRDLILAASGLYLFGFTYLYVALGQLMRLDGTGLGWFSLFVAGCAVVYSALSFVRTGDPAFGVIWLQWAFLWFLFFLTLGLGRTDLNRYTGLVAVVQGISTAAVPALLLITGSWDRYQVPAAVVLAVVGVVCLAGLHPALMPRFARPLSGTSRAPTRPAAGQGAPAGR